MIRFELTPHRIGRILVTGSVIVVTTSLFFGVSLAVLGDDTPILSHIFRAVDVNEEGNLATYYGAGLLLIAAGLATSLATATRTTSWIVVSVFLFALFVDEVAHFHEQTSDEITDWLGTGGYSDYSWTIAAVPIVILLAFPTARLFRSLNPTARRTAIAAVGIYLFGALVLESIGGATFAATDGGDTTGLRVLMHLEEFSEMVGASLMSVAIAHVIIDRRDGLAVAVLETTA